MNLQMSFSIIIYYYYLLTFKRGRGRYFAKHRSFGHTAIKWMLLKRTFEGNMNRIIVIVLVTQNTLHSHPAEIARAWNPRTSAQASNFVTRLLTTGLSRNLRDTDFSISKVTAEVLFKRENDCLFLFFITSMQFSSGYLAINMKSCFMIAPG